MPLISTTCGGHHELQRSLASFQVSLFSSNFQQNEHVLRHHCEDSHNMPVLGVKEGIHLC